MSFIVKPKCNDDNDESMEEVLGTVDFDGSVYHVKEFLSSMPTDLSDLTLALMSGMCQSDISQENNITACAVSRDVAQIREKYMRYAGGEVA